MLLMSPPEWVLLEYLVLLEILPYPPTFVVGKGQSILLEKSVDSGNAPVP